jgi:hypothetical protein
MLSCAAGRDGSHKMIELALRSVVHSWCKRVEEQCE